jgi:hypothetical protein
MPSAGTGSGGYGKRIAALTGYIIALVIAAGSLGLYRIDADDYRDEAQALLRLKRFNEFLEANPPESLRIPLHRAAREELGRRDKPLDAARLAAQQTLVNHLIVGLEGRSPTGCAFFGREVVEGKIASVDQAPTVEFSFVVVRSPFLDPPPAATELAERGTVDYLLTRLDEFFSPVDVDTVRSIPLGELPDPCENERMETQQVTLDPSSWQPPFRSALLTGDRVVVEFAGTPPFQQQQQQQLAERIDIVEVPVAIGTAQLTSSAELLGVEHQALARDLTPLWERPATKLRLTRDYGFLPIDYAVSTAGATLVQGYTGATILGVKLAPRRVALIVSVVALGLVSLIARECQSAAREGVSLRDPDPDGPRAQLLNSLAGRTFAWVLGPAAAIAFASPPTLTWIAAAVAAVLVGAAAVLWSRSPYGSVATVVP